MNFFIRADASTRIGNGHVMRCLTLANGLKQHGGNISFICREDRGNLIQILEAQGYKTHRLPAGIQAEDDKECIQNVLRNQREVPDWLIIDHYDLDISYECSLRSFVKHIMVIDDFENRCHDCDLLLNQNYNPNSKRYQDLVPAHCTRLLGPEYALLRPQFRQVRGHLCKRNDAEFRLFVFMGGSDPKNTTYKVLRAIQQFERADIHADIVIGPSNPYNDEIESLASQIPNTTCHIQVDNMGELMATAHIGIGAAGTTTWERCCVGLPSIVIVLAENQRAIAENLDKDGFVINLGRNKTVTEHHIKSSIKFLMQNPDKREMMSEQSKKLVDGKGSNRVIDKILYF